MGDAGAGRGQPVEVVVFEVAAVNADEARAKQAEALEAGQRREAMQAQALVDLMPGFMNMAVDWDIELRRQGHQSFERGVGHRVGGVRGEAEADQGVVQPVFANGEALVDVIVGVAGIRRREFQCRDAEHGTHAEFRGGSGCRLGEEVHVVEAGDAAREHFSAGQARAVINELRRGMGRLGRPDVLLQPVQQRQVVGQPAHQRHRGVGMEVYQAGNQQMVFEHDAAGRCKPAARLAAWQQCDDPALMNRQCMPFEHHVGVDRGNPARLDQQVDQFGSCLHGERRLFQCGSRVKIANYARFNQ